MKIVFLGRVFPQHIRFSVEPQGIDWTHPDGTLVNCLLTISDGSIKVECTVQRVDRDLVRELRSRVFDFAQLLASQLTFVTGRSFTVILEDFIDDRGIHSPIWFGSDDLGRLCTVLRHSENNQLTGFRDVARIIGGDFQATFAFNDLTACLAHPDLTAINCARMVDALRHLVGHLP